MEKKSVYINNCGSSWILAILGKDIFREMTLLGYDCHEGGNNDYAGEEIALHMWWRTAQPFSEAKVNALFVTHIDDIGKERDLLLQKNHFDRFICMSREDARFLVELGFDADKVFGVDLPVRNTYIKPFSLGIFSNCYPDNRKNESWILEYCKTHKDSELVCFSFVGKGWGKVVNELESLGCSSVWYNISRSLPSEYTFQQLALSQVDEYIYMGMDGGAMGTYDAYAMGVDLCVSDDGYHKSIPDISYSFSDKQGFFDCLDEIIAKQARRHSFFRMHDAAHYVAQVTHILETGKYPAENAESESDYSVLQKRRGNYFPMSLRRLWHPFKTKVMKKQLRTRRK